MAIKMIPERINSQINAHTSYKMQHRLLVCVFFFCWHVLVLSKAIVTASAQDHARTNETDREALLALKSGIKNMGFWDPSLHFCRWGGVTCDSENQRVIYLDLSSQHLVGTLSPFIGNLTSLKVLVLGGNKFRGLIPAQIGALGSCEKLDLGSNHFEGTIPSSFQQLRGLWFPSISYNNLSGVIPEFLGDLPFLHHLDLSYNDFVGRVPVKGVFMLDSVFGFQFSGNKELCGGALRLRLPPCPVPRKQNAVAAIVLPIVALVGIVVLLVTVYWRRKQARSNVLVLHPVSVVPSLPELHMFSGPSYHELVQATGHFSTENLLGRGSFGSVYKGILSTGELLAVKVFDLNVRGANRSFLAECQALKNIRHRNLVKIISACSSIDFNGQDFKALLYEFMVNGNLDSWLHQEGSRGLDLTRRLNIAIDVANALEYLHHGCHEPVIHCDLKPSNILLDSDLVAHVGDFGLARLVTQPESSGQSRTSSIGVKGTVGYIPPEYSMGIKASEKGDVYSYGIILLELFTGKRPTNAMFSGDITIRSFIEMGLSNDQVMHIVDAQLLLMNEEAEEEQASSSKSAFQLGTGSYCTINEGLASVLRTGLLCSAESPRDRIDVRYALKELLRVKELFAL